MCDPLSIQDQSVIGSNYCEFLCVMSTGEGGREGDREQQQQEEEEEQPSPQFNFSLNSEVHFQLMTFFFCFHYSSTAASQHRSQRARLTPSHPPAPTAGLRLLPQAEPQRITSGGRVLVEWRSGSESESESPWQCPGREVRVWGPGCSSCWARAWRRRCWPRDVAATRRTRSSCSAAPRSVSGNEWRWLR